MSGDGPMRSVPIEQRVRDLENNVEHCLIQVDELRKDGRHERAKGWWASMWAGLVDLVNWGVVLGLILGAVWGLYTLGTHHYKSEASECAAACRGIGGQFVQDSRFYCVCSRDRSVFRFKNSYGELEEIAP